ncbi:MAG: glycosyltransferase family 2 protein [Chloroflexi bacterium]|nr:glycosyltransferase family 2 protein [Chloroflexota bacterium]
MTTLDVSIIILNWNTRDLLADCLGSIALTSGALKVETIVVDNNSSDGSQAMVQEQFPEVRLIQNQHNVGFAKGNNQAMETMQGRYALLFNSDALATPGSIQALIELADSQPRAGIVGALLVNPDGSFQASHTPFPNLWQEFLILSGLGRLLHRRWYPSKGPEEAKGPQKVDYVEGACLLVRREAFEQAGGLDEGYFMYAEEVDWCYAMKKAGWQVWYQPKSRIVHYGGGSSKNRRTQREADLYRSRVRFFRKHYGNAAASALKFLIYTLTAVKIVAHRFLRLVSGNRRGRPVVGMGDLMASLREV